MDSINGVSRYFISLFAILLTARFRNNAKRSLHEKEIKIITHWGGREMDKPHLLLKEIYSIDLTFRARQKIKIFGL